MRESWILISYGDFNKTKKLFSYDRFGLHTLPLFKDAIVANEFLTNVLSLYKTKKDFRLNYCESNKQIITILNLVTMATHDLNQVIIDPVFAEGNTPDRIRICENVMQVEDFIDSISSPEDQTQKERL